MSYGQKEASCLVMKLIEKKKIYHAGSVHKKLLIVNIDNKDPFLSLHTSYANNRSSADDVKDAYKSGS